MCELDEDELLEESEFWRFVAARVFGLMLADLIAHPEGARMTMEAMDRG